MSLLEQIYKSIIFLAIFITGGSYFFISIVIALLNRHIQAEEFILSIGWVLLSIIYLIDRFKCTLFRKHRNLYILAIYLILILFTIYNEKIN